jgi:hypothetical protein
VGPSFGAGLAFDAEWWDLGLAPTLALGAEYVSGAAAPGGNGSEVVVRSALAELDGCLAAWRPLQRRVSLAGCARVEAGARFAAGLDVPGGHTVTRPWVAAGPSVRLRVDVRRWFVGLSAGLFFPFIRDDVGLLGTPSPTPAFSVGAVGVRGTLATGIHFP